MDQALPVESVDFDHSVEVTNDISNMTAEEYLSWVRYQADKLPLVIKAPVVSKTSNDSIKTNIYDTTIKSTLSQCYPNEEWENDALHSFSELRLFVHKISLLTTSKTRDVEVPPLKDSNGWKYFSFGYDFLNYVTTVNNQMFSNDNNDDDNNDNDEQLLKRRKLELVNSLDHELKSENTLNDNDDDDDNDDNNNDVYEEEEHIHIEDNKDNTLLPSSTPNNNTQYKGLLSNVFPSLKLLCQFDQVMIQRLLQHHIAWIEEYQSCFIHPNQGLWLYALLVRLEKPLHRDIAATIRALYTMSCDFKKAYLQSIESNIEREEDKDEASIPSSSSSSSTSCSSNNNDLMNLSATNYTHIEHLETNTLEIQKNSTSDLPLSSKEVMTSINSTNKLSILNLLISISGSYFGQGEIYDSKQYQEKPIIITTTTATSSSSNDGNNTSHILSSSYHSSTSTGVFTNKSDELQERGDENEYIGETFMINDLIDYDNDDVDEDNDRDNDDTMDSYKDGNTDSQRDYEENNSGDFNKHISAYINKHTNKGQQPTEELEDGEVLL